MSNQVTGVGGDGGFGANSWLVDELYEQFKQDRNSVDKEWWPILENYTPDAAAAQTARTSDAPSVAPVTAPIPVIGAQPVARTTAKPAKQAPIPAQAPKPQAKEETESAEEDKVTPLRGMPKTLAANMDQSLTVPTATSVRTIPAKLMIDNRIVINNHMSRTRGGKVSFTHLIGWALIKTLKEFPSQNVFYAEIDGKPSVVAPAHVNLGIAVDVPKPDGTRALLVPSIKRADTMTFGEYLLAYEDLIARARNNKDQASTRASGHAAGMTKTVAPRST